MHLTSKTTQFEEQILLPIKRQLFQCQELNSFVKHDEFHATLRDGHFCSMSLLGLIDFKSGFNAFIHTEIGEFILILASM